ncbi:unnamed protein product [Chrysodeixis includens]|uniref:NADH dehydrogenase [ubiquinone] 1 alpha subcomplex subunit 7 n=1 Tax=Chrysodeixis includens TaxID=689277 RepID=A0A9P0FQW0_CHRIL|nr:unnamed protein product [Chrysodeixis includens]
MVKKGALKFEFRDVSSVFQKIRDFILGGKFKLENRFPPLISPRAIQRPDIPRGPEHKYADRWYSKRYMLDSVKPPVLSSLADGKPVVGGGFPCVMKSEAVAFNCPPTAGAPWLLDGHCYYEFVAANMTSQSGCPPSQPSNPCDDQNQNQQQNQQNQQNQQCPSNRNQQNQNPCSDQNQQSNNPCRQNPQQSCN